MLYITAASKQVWVS